MNPVYSTFTHFSAFRAQRTSSLESWGNREHLEMSTELTALKLC